MSELRGFGFILPEGYNPLVPDVSKDYRGMPDSFTELRFQHPNPKELFQEQLRFADIEEACKIMSEKVRPFPVELALTKRAYYELRKLCQEPNTDHADPSGMLRQWPIPFGNIPVFTGWNEMIRLWLDVNRQKYETPDLDPRLCDYVSKTRWWLRRRQQIIAAIKKEKVEAIARYSDGKTTVYHG